MNSIFFVSLLAAVQPLAIPLEDFAAVAAVRCAAVTDPWDGCYREIAEVAGIDEKDILYISPSNEALAHLPYMIALDR